MRVTYLVDGYNLHHSIKAIKKELGHEARWLDLSSLFSSYLYLIDKKATLESVYFFTALRRHVQHRKPESIQRHKEYMKVLENDNISIEYGRFKKKPTFCTECHKTFKKHEEKETDVAIASKLLELAYHDASDVYVLVSGDTDMCPAIKTVKELYPNIKVYSLFPFARKNDDLKKFVDGHWTIKAKSYLKHQLPSPAILKDGTEIMPPKKWEPTVVSKVA